MELGFSEAKLTTNTSQALNQNLGLLRYEYSRPKMFHQVILHKQDTQIFSRSAEHFRDELVRIVLLLFHLLLNDSWF